MPSLSALRALAVFAETGSMTAAGNALNVSHAAVSQQLRALESRLGVSLLCRAGRGTVMTPEGARLAQSARDGFNLMARELDALTGADAVRALQISTSPTFAALWLMPRLPRFSARAPHLDVMLNPTPALVSLEPGGIDVAIRYGDGNWPGHDVVPLIQSPLVVVAAPSLVGEGPVDGAQALLRHPWLEEYGTNESTDWLRRRGVMDRPGGMLQVPGNLLIDGARTGQGIAVTVRCFVEEDIASGRLRLLFSEDGSKGYFILTRPGVQRAPVREFLRWLACEKLRPET
ncbi:LysR family transcriptional regulator [Poseidonocella pacifica]